MKTSFALPNVARDASDDTAGGATLIDPKTGQDLPKEVVDLIREKLMTPERRLRDVASLAATNRAHRAQAWSQPCPSRCAEALSSRVDVARQGASYAHHIFAQISIGEPEAMRLPDMEQAADKMCRSTGKATYSAEISSFHKKLSAMESASRACDAFTSPEVFSPEPPPLAWKEKNMSLALGLCCAVAAAMSAGSWRISSPLLSCLYGALLSSTRTPNWVERGLVSYLITQAGAAFLGTYARLPSARVAEEKKQMYNDNLDKYQRYIHKANDNLRDKVITLSRLSGSSATAKDHF